MSCGPEPSRFRLLGAYAGWEALDHRNLSGFAEDAAGLTLERIDEGLTERELATLLLPPRLARGCGPCDWYLLTPSPSRLLRKGACSSEWLPVWSPACDPRLLVEPIAVAASGHRFAIAEANRIRIWSGDGAQLSADLGLEGVTAIAFTPWGELLVATGESPALLRFGPEGPRGVYAAVPDGAGAVQTIAASMDCAVWVVTRDASGVLRLWRAGWRASEGCGDPRASELAPARLDQLRAAVAPTGVKLFGEPGFCLESTDAGGMPRALCYSWFGRALDESAIPLPPLPPAFVKRGQLLTRAIDSGIPRCRWHRVRLEADIPEGTQLAIAVASSEEAAPDPQGDRNANPEWRNFAAGAPHPLDWQTAPAGSLDFLVDQPAGRYLFVRVRLTSDGAASPVVKRIRLDFPRSTSLERLPPVYRENPDAEDFTERFLALFDAGLADVDRAIERFPAMLDAEGAPDEVLPWLGSFLDLAFDPLWEPARRRAILRALPRLYRARGTLDGLKAAIRLVFDLEPAIDESGRERAWGALGRSTHLNGVRLFGKAKARIRLGRSPLGRTPLKSYGNPDHDPLASGAHRFRVLVPPGKLARGIGLERLRSLIERQKPAHTLASVRVGGSGLVLGTWSAVGVDTMFGPLEAPVLGGASRPGNVRLNRMSVLRRNRRSARSGVVVAGAGTVVGKPIVME